MTTVYMERGSHHPSGESYDERDAYLQLLTERVGSYAGSVATATQLPPAETAVEG